MDFYHKPFNHQTLINYIKLLAILFACTLFTATLTSCGDDDENDNQTTSTNTGGSHQGSNGGGNTITFDKTELYGEWADQIPFSEYRVYMSQLQKDKAKDILRQKVTITATTFQISYRVDNGWKVSDRYTWTLLSNDQIKINNKIFKFSIYYYDNASTYLWPYNGKMKTLDLENIDNKDEWYGLDCASTTIE